MGGKVTDITGQTFGWLTAIRFVETRGKMHKAVWTFLCKCGKEKDLCASDVKSGRTKSCGCSHIKDVTGEKFGRLTALENMGIGYNGHQSCTWRCICECGNETYVTISMLVGGHTKSCGCLQREILGNSRRTHGLSRTKEGNRAKSHRYRERHKWIDGNWTAKMERELSLFFTSCVVCGDTKNLETDHVRPNSKGYGLAPGNAVRLCKRHNGSGFKGNKMPEELPDYARDKILEAAHKFEVYWNSLGEK